MQTVIAVGSFYAQRLELVWSEDPNVSYYLYYRKSLITYAYNLWVLNFLPKKDYVTQTMWEYYCNYIQDNWKNTDLQKSVLIDTAGWYFDVHFHDMTMNGKEWVFDFIKRTSVD